MSGVSEWRSLSIRYISVSETYTPSIIIWAFAAVYVLQSAAFPPEFLVHPVNPVNPVADAARNAFQLFLCEIYKHNTVIYNVRDNCTL